MKLPKKTFFRLCIRCNRKLMEKRMGQGEILEVLKKKDDWMSTMEITKELNASRSAITQILKKLYRNNDVIKRETRKHYPIPSINPTHTTNKICNEFKINQNTEE